MQCTHPRDINGDNVNSYRSIIVTYTHTDTLHSVTHSRPRAQTQLHTNTGGWGMLITAMQLIQIQSRDVSTDFPPTKCCSVCNVRFLLRLMFIYGWMEYPVCWESNYLRSLRMTWLGVNSIKHSSTILWIICGKKSRNNVIFFFRNTNSERTFSKDDSSLVWIPLVCWTLYYVYSFKAILWPQGYILL